MEHTSIHFTIIIDDAAFHAVRPTPREHARWRLLGVKVLGVRLRTGSVRSKHLLELVNFKNVSANHSRRVDRSVPVIPARLTTWMYRTPEIIEWLTLKVIRTLKLRQRSAHVMLVIPSHTCTRRPP